MKAIKNILLMVPMLLIGAVIVYAAAPSGGYNPNATLDPDCAPGDADCFVKSLGKFIDGTTVTDAVYTAGNVGIGTTTPTQKLDVQGNAVFRAGDGDIGVLINSSMSQGGSVRLYDPTGSTINTMLSGRGDAPSYFIGTNVGIGTVTPGTKLEVAAASTSDGIVLSRGGANRVKMSADGTMTWGANADQGYLAWDTGRAIVTSLGGNNLSLSAATIVNQMTLHTNGNVGIGTTAPGAKLEVSGDIKILNPSYTGGNTGFDMYHNAGGANDFGLVTQKNDVDIVGIDSDQSTYTSIDARGMNMALNPSTGNVGIGTTAPGAKLDVDGDVNFGDGSGQILVVQSDGQLAATAGPVTVNDSLTLGNNAAYDFTIGKLSGSYTNNSAFVCVNNAGTLYASEVACP